MATSTFPRELAEGFETYQPSAMAVGRWMGYQSGSDFPGGWFSPGGYWVPFETERAVCCDAVVATADDPYALLTHIVSPLHAAMRDGADLREVERLIALAIDSGWER